MLHVLPDAQGGHDPPQSIALSVPFFRPSLHEGPWPPPAVHTPVAQSEPTRQGSPEAQGAHDPPQSTPVSVPFFTPSLHDPLAQTPPAQTPLAQSAFAPQGWPPAHGGHDPPQSTAVSFPFSVPSLQAGDAQKPPTHTPLEQPAPLPQCDPLPPGVISHPFEGSPSQSYAPALHAESVHVPVAHDALACGRAHTTPHAPQSVFVVSSVSQPSAGSPLQSAKPRLHAPT